MNRLRGKVVVITGGSSGMGLAAAQRFVAEGAFVFITGRRQAELDIAVNAIGENVRGVQGDVSNLSDLERLFHIVKEEKGRIDVLYANAGIAGTSMLESVDEDHFDTIIGVNMRGTLFLVQKALPLFNNGGSIILKGSIAGAKSRVGRTVYGASKAALRSFARTWASEFADRRIRVNVLSPGPVDTPALVNAPQTVRMQLMSQIPRGTLGDVKEIAAAALFLASDEASFVNGVEFFVDGGFAQI